VLDFPTEHDGVRGMRFLDAVVASARTGGWVELASDVVAPAAARAKGGGRS
jgi:hypothetical protein